MRPNKKYGFRRFINKIENKEPNVRVKYCDKGPLIIYSFKAIESVLNGRFFDTTKMFHWDSSPQGAAYWYQIQNMRGRDPLPKDAKKFLEYLLNEENHVNNLHDEATHVSLAKWVMPTEDPYNDD